MARVTIQWSDEVDWSQHAREGQVIKYCGVLWRHNGERFVRYRWWRRLFDRLRGR